MTRRTLTARVGAWLACASFVVLAASCQKIIGIEDLEACGCYDGPPETKSVGVCKPGCPADGGVCAGEVLPQTEDCSTADVDENCDGKTACTGHIAWKVAGDAADSAPGLILVPANTGGVLIGGSTVDEVQIDGRKAFQKGAVMSFVTALDQNGDEPSYITPLVATGKNAAVIVTTLAAFPVDQVVVGAEFQGRVAWLSGAPTAQPPSAFIAVLDGKTGAIKGGQALLAGAGSNVFLKAIATLDAGDVFACGELDGTMTLPDGTKLTAKHTEGDAFVVHFLPDGSVAGKAIFPGGLCDQIATNASGDVAIAGRYYAPSFRLGGQPFGAPGGDEDIFVGLLSDDLTPKWGAAIYGLDDEEVDGLAFDPKSGNVVLGGTTGPDTISVGTAAYMPSGGSDLFFAAWDPGGKLVYLKGLGGPNDQLMYGFTVDGAGQLVASGTFNGKIDAPGCHLASSGTGHVEDTGDAFVIKLSPEAEPIWCYSAGTSKYLEDGLAVATDAGGSVYLGGDFVSTIAFQGQTALNCGQTCGTGLYVIKLDP